MKQFRPKSQIKIKWSNIGSWENIGFHVPFCAIEPKKILKFIYVPTYVYVFMVFRYVV
jgi:hypothetical protein